MASRRGFFESLRADPRHIKPGTGIDASRITVEAFSSIRQSPKRLAEVKKTLYQLGLDEESQRYQRFPATQSAVRDAIDLLFQISPTMPSFRGIIRSAPIGRPYNIVYGALVSYDGKPIGMVQYSSPCKDQDGLAYAVRGIELHPDFRHKGIGRAISHLMDPIAERLALDYVVSNTANPAAIRNLAQSGWQLMHSTQEPMGRSQGWLEVMHFRKPISKRALAAFS